MSSPLSMTSYGRGAAEYGGQRITAEVRSVNHRYLDLRIKMSRRLLPLEERIRKKVAAVFSRGHVEVGIDCPETLAGRVRLVPDLDLARQYHRGLRRLASSLGIREEPDLALLASFRDIFVTEEENEDLEALWPALASALDAALGEAGAMRAAEGKNLRADLLGRLEALENTVNAIEAGLPAVLEERQAALAARIGELLADERLDPARMHQEAAILADRTDVTEELVRLRSHFGQFRAIIDEDEPVGRRLDFLLQEFFREINTIASKIANAAIAHHTVTLKNEVEKMREQVQNLE